MSAAMGWTFIVYQMDSDCDCQTRLRDMRGLSIWQSQSPHWFVLRPLVVKNGVCVADH
jgi:hypothetical protein